MNFDEDETVDPYAAEHSYGSVVLPGKERYVPPIRQQVLDEAADLIVGDREKDYGAPEDNFQRIADAWNLLFKHMFKDGHEFTPSMAALAMLALKLARTPQGYKHDTAVDAAGYAALYAELSERGL